MLQFLTASLCTYYTLLPYIFVTSTIVCYATISYFNIQYIYNTCMTYYKQVMYACESMANVLCIVVQPHVQ